MGQTEIVVRGASEHNLKDIDVRIPRDQLVVITGLSGSGKSSLAFDTLYAEGQRRYVESLSSYARQFLGQMKKPEVEHVEGLSPAISIDQKTTHTNPRSTVGTVTEIYDYLRLLFAHVGRPHCPSCGKRVQKQSAEEIVNQILELPDGTKIQILAPLVRGRKGTYKKLFQELAAKGYARARVNGAVHALDAVPDLARYEKHDIEVVVDRCVVRDDQFSRIQDSVEQALEAGEGVVIVNLADGVTPGSSKQARTTASDRRANMVAKKAAKSKRATGKAPKKQNLSPKANKKTAKDAAKRTARKATKEAPKAAAKKDAGKTTKKATRKSAKKTSTKSASKATQKTAAAAPETAPGSTGGKTKVTKLKGSASEQDLMFSEHFACPDCNISLPEIVPRIFSFNSPHGACDGCSGLGFRLSVDPDKIIAYPENSPRKAFDKAIYRINSWLFKWFDILGEHYKVDVKQPWQDLPDWFQDILLYGTEDEIEVTWSGDNYEWSGEWAFEGIAARMDRLYRESESDSLKSKIEKFHTEKACTTCGGQRLRKEVLAVRIQKKNIIEVTQQPVDRALAWFEALDEKLTKHERHIAAEVLKEIRARLGFLVNVGLGYLDLARTSGTLSGGEAQRIRLATQIGSGLVGVLYILDEPSIGLHQRDNQKLLKTLQHLRDTGNTVLVVEHDEETMWAADHLIDLGPGAGEHGGQIVAQGTPKQVARTKGSITGDYLSHRRSIAIPEARREGNGGAIRIVGAAANNLKNVNVDIPLGQFVCVTGVSGSGKSSLINEVLVKGAMRKLRDASGSVPGKHKDIQGLDHVDKLIVIDQSPIGRTPRSNPATYTGLFTPIRDMFSMTQESKKRGYKPGRFSFNVKGGRCESCAGDGMVKIEMHFLPDVYVPCEICKGDRYNRETLTVTYKGKNIKQVLDMTVEEALLFFDAIPAIRNKLQTLHDVGLDYIRLGQPATTLSGGEAQRVKLATELSKRSTGKTLYVLDEPTTGLHFHDITYLLGVLNRLADGGNTVLVIEHNLDVIKTADHIIDIGPEGGEAGGQIVAQGTPEEIAASGTWTGKYLAHVLEHNTLVSDEVKKGRKKVVQTVAH